MIVYDLKCENGHTFEGWFKDSSAFTDQQARNLIRCPVCGSAGNEVVPSSVMYIGKGASSPRSRERNPEEPSLQEACDLLKDYVEHHFEDVGDRFTEVAAKIHRGLEEERNIRGTTTQSEEEYLKAEGIAFLKIHSVKLNT